MQEVGGLDPVTASAATLERARLLAGAEIGHYWIVDQKVLDLAAYGKFVDNFSQDFSAVVVSLGAQSITVQAIGESRYGADAGASASLSLSNTAALSQLRRQVSRGVAVASGDYGRRAQVVNAQSMIRKSGHRFSLATNAERVCAEIMLKQ